MIYINGSRTVKICAAFAAQMRRTCAARIRARAAPDPADICLSVVLRPSWSARVVAEVARYRRLTHKLAGRT